MPTTRDQHLGQGQAHPAVALGLDDDERAGLGDREVRAGDADLGAQELLAQVQPGRLGQLGRLVGQVVGGGPAGRGHLRRGRSRGSRRGCGGSPAPGCGWAGRRRAARSARPGRSPRRRCPRAASASLRLDLLGRHRLDLDDLVDAVAPWRRRRRPRTPRRRRAPSARSRPRAVSDSSSRSRCSSRWQQGVVLDRRAGQPQLLPVVDLGDDPAPLGADRARSRARGCAAAGCRPARRAPPPGTPASRRTSPQRPVRLGRVRGRRALLATADRRRRPASRPGASRGRRPAGATAARRRASGTSCRRRPAPRRRSRARAAPCRSPSPPRCRRSSPRTCRRSRSTRSAPGSSTSRSPRTARSSRVGRSPTPSIRSEWQVGW